MINCLVIDDEPLALQLMEDFIRKTPYLNLVGSFDVSLQALPLIESGGVDLLFLDIRMPDISGVDFFRLLHRKPEVIFTTAYSEYALEGFELKAMDYLLKPVSFEKFVAATNRVREFLENKHPRYQPGEEYFFMNVAHKLHKIFYHDILFLEGYKDYTKLHLAGSSSPLLVLHNLKYFEDLLNPQEFIRIHRSYIVPIRRVNTVARKTVTILTHQLPVSDNYRERFFSIVERYAR